MSAYILNRKMELKEGYSANTEQERKSLIDYIRSQSLSVAEHLDYVMNYLHSKLPFVNLKSHAKNLPTLNDQRKNHNIRKLVYGLNETELPVVKDYFTKTIAAYLEGKQKFETVDKALDDIIDLKPIPDTARIPPDSEFFKGRPGRTLADMREEV